MTSSILGIVAFNSFSSTTPSARVSATHSSASPTSLDKVRNRNPFLFHRHVGIRQPERHTPCLALKKIRHFAIV
jgi:hypothetical protein